MSDGVNGGLVGQQEPIIILRGASLACVQMALAATQPLSQAALLAELKDNPEWKFHRGVANNWAAAAVAMARFYQEKTHRRLRSLNLSGEELKIP